MDSQPPSVVQGKLTSTPNNPNPASKTTTEEVAGRGIEVHGLVLILLHPGTWLKMELRQRGFKGYRGAGDEVEAEVVEEEEVQG